MNRANCILVFVFTLIFILPGADVFAVCPFPCCPAHLSAGQCAALQCAPCAPIPLDGGLSALLVAGIAYGSKKVFGKSKA